MALVAGPAGAGARGDRAGDARPDADGDGVADAADRCPDRAGVLPEGCPPVDSDGDQVIDARDECPRLPGPKLNRGCPDSDGDGDGVVDRRDECPRRYGHRDFAGCPVPDADGDAVADARDRCPKKPEVWNGTRDGDGCPDSGAPLLSVRDRRIRFARVPRLAEGDSRMSARGKRMVQAAATALETARARIARLEVVGEYGLSYGDSLQRTRRRAQVIRRALLAATSMEPGDLEVVCLGPDGDPRVVLTYP